MGEPDRISNEIAFSLAPTIVIAPLQAAAGDLTLKVVSNPLVRPEQRVSLLFRDGEIVAPSRTAATSTLLFNLKAVPRGEHVIRLRVDGVDSLPIDRGATAPKFADKQKLKVT